MTMNKRINKWTGGEIFGKCFICENECSGTSWHIQLNCWVYICSEECLAVKNNPEAYEIVKEQILKELKKNIDPNKSYLPKDRT